MDNDCTTAKKMNDTNFQKAQLAKRHIHIPEGFDAFALIRRAARGRLQKVHLPADLSARITFHLPAVQELRYTTVCFQLLKVSALV